MVCRGKEKRKRKKRKYLVRGGGDTAEGKGGQHFGEGKIVGQKEERIGSIFYFKFTFFSIQFTMFSRRQDGGAYRGADVSGKCMVSLGKLVLFAFVASWYGWFWSTAKFGDNW